MKTISVGVKTHNISHKKCKEVEVEKKTRKTYVVGNVANITQKAENHVFVMLPSKREKGRCPLEDAKSVAVRVVT